MSAASPNLVNFQGKVVNADGTNVADGTYNFNFVLFSDPTLGTENDGVYDKWRELNKSVGVSGGIFQTNLGSATALPDFNANPSLYLAVKFNGDSQGYMTPRIQLTSTPYALNADKLAGLSPAAFVQMAQGLQTDSSASNASIAINKTGTTANILQLQRGGADVLLIDNGGLLSYKPQTGNDNATAFKIQNAGGTEVLLSADTVARGAGGGNVIKIGDSTGTDGSLTILKVDAAGSDPTSNLSTLNGGIFYNSGTGKLSIIEANSVKVLCNKTDMSCSTLQQAYDATSGNTITTTTGRDLTVALADTATDANFLVNVASSSTSKFAVQYNGVDTFAINNAASAQGSATFRNATNNTSAFQIQNAAAAQIFNIDTTNPNLIATNPGFEANPLTGWSGLSGGSVARDTTQAYVGVASGKVTSGTTGGGGISQSVTLANSTQYTLSFYARLDTASAAFSTLQAGYSSTGAVGGEVDCALSSNTVLANGWNRYYCTFTTPASNSGSPYIYIQHSDTTSQVYYMEAVQLEQAALPSAYGAGTISLNATISSPAIFQNIADSATALQVQNSTNLNLFTIDTASSNINNLLKVPSFESATLTGWTARTGCTLTQDQTQYLNGYNSAKCTNAATTNAGINLDATATGLKTALAINSTYTFSVYVKSSALMSTLEIGRADVSGTDINCLTAQTVTSSGWTRFSCTFTTGGTLTNPYVYVKQTDATARSIWVDAAILETDANASTNYRDGKISLGQATVTSQMLFQTANNSTTAFQIQNATGAQIFNVDTTDTNLITNPGFEANTSGWAAALGTTTIRRETSQTYLGLASMKVTTSATALSGAQYSLNPIVTAASTSYTVSWFAKLDAASAAFTDIMARYSPDGTATADCTGINTQTVVTGGWTRYTCQVTSATAPTTSGYLKIMQVAGAAHTFYVDGVQMEAGANASAYGAGSLAFNGVFTSPVNMKSVSDSTNAFQIQNSAGTNMLNVDSLNNRLTVGVGDATGTVLVLDTKNTSGDPTAVDGAMYYNSNTHSFRCGVASAWVSCIGGLVAANTSVPAGNTVATTVTETNFASNYAMPANYCTQGRVVRVTAQGVYGTTAATPTLIIRMKAGTTVLGVAPTITTVASQTNRTWRVQFQTTCNAAPSATSATENQGILTLFNTNASTGVNYEMSNTATINLATNGALTLQLSAQWGTSNAANTITLRQLIVEGIGP